ncbi:MAG TPA: hypothetical protein VL096_15815 [Pirellulaceae bacterium]|nr:hypothetical protein [Pirellulaceae bacterium]
MPRLLFVCLVVVTLTVVGGVDAVAGPFRRNADRNLDARSNTNRTLTQRDREALAAYPKYYGGFHSRDLSNIGIPNGDIGIRGNGINMLPW